MTHLVQPSAKHCDTPSSSAARCTPSSSRALNDGLSRVSSHCFRYFAFPVYVFILALTLRCHLSLGGDIWHILCSVTARVPLRTLSTFKRCHCRRPLRHPSPLYDHSNQKAGTP